MATLDQERAWVYAVFDKYLPKVQELLGIQLSTQPKVKFSENVGNKGDAGITKGANGTIVLDPSVFDAKNQGAVVHELTHYLLGQAGTSVYNDQTSWQHEGIADAVRYLVVPDNGTKGDPGWKPNADAQEFLALHNTTPDAWHSVIQSVSAGNNFSQEQLHSVINGSAPAAVLDPQGTAAADAAGTSYSTTPPPTGTGGTNTASQRAALNASASFRAMVSSWGLDPQQQNMQALIENAAHHGWNSTRFLNQLQQTPEFQQRFPGIFNDSGGLKMSPAAYIQQEKAYQNVAQAAGININDNKLGYLFRNDVSTQELQTRATALSRLRDNADMFQAFNKQLQAEGIAPQGGLSKGDLFKFIMGQGDKQWYQSWNNAVSRYSGNEAGIQFGKAPTTYTNLSNKTVTKIAGKGLSESALAQGYQGLAQQLTTTLPLSKIQKLGLSKQDLVELQFGGKRQAAVAQRVQQILSNEKNIESAPKAELGGLQVGSRRGIQQDRPQTGY